MYKIIFQAKKKKKILANAWCLATNKQKRNKSDVFCFSNQENKNVIVNKKGHPPRDDPDVWSCVTHLYVQSVNAPVNGKTSPSEGLSTSCVVFEVKPFNHKHVEISMRCKEQRFVLVFFWSNVSVAYSL